MSDELGLLAAVIDAVDDTPRLVSSDWRIVHGRSERARFPVLLDLVPEVAP